jgi:hypothetical protein
MVGLVRQQTEKQSGKKSRTKPKEGKKNAEATKEEEKKEMGRFNGAKAAQKRERNQKKQADQTKAHSILKTNASSLTIKCAVCMVRCSFPFFPVSPFSFPSLSSRSLFSDFFFFFSQNSKPSPVLRMKNRFANTLTIDTHKNRSRNASQASKATLELDALVE